MGNVGKARRAGARARAGRQRARQVAARLGVALADARRIAGLHQVEAATAVGLSQARFSELERGLGQGASLETWALAAAGVGEQVVAFLEHAPGAARPRDIEHLRRQAALIELAVRGGWSALPELAIDPGAVRSRSVDVALTRPERREAVVAEIWDWFDDVGAGLRSVDGKRDAVISRLERALDGQSPARWMVRCLYVVRRTRRNVRLLGELRPLFAARFPGSSRAWLRALTDPDTDLPLEDGLIWSTSTGAFQASRLRGPR
jgi:transcriptional regulator with XRE-family HTH domain